MGKLLSNLDRKYALGLLTGLIFGFLSVYTDFYRSTSPQIQFDILSNTTVVDLKENINKIDILYDSTSILSKRETLSLITLKITNNGNSNVLKNYYDNQFPLGFVVDNGIILEKPTLIQSSNDYLKESIGQVLKNENKVKFTDFIFEKDDFFVLKILVLHNMDEHPEIIPEGKIAGVSKISIVKSYLNKETRTFWQRIFEGSILIHVTRFFIYLLAIFLLVATIMLPFGFISDKFEKRNRKRIIRNFKSYLKRDFTVSETFIVEFFLKNGLYGLRGLIEISLQKRKFKRIFESIEINSKSIYMPKESIRGYSEMEALDLIKEMKKQHYLFIEDNSVNFKDNLDSFVKELISFVESH